jgi:hypothetical protein
MQKRPVESLKRNGIICGVILSWATIFSEKQEIYSISFQYKDTLNFSIGKFLSDI